MAKTLIGTVVSLAGAKSVVIVVRSKKTHPIYKKQYSVNQKIMIHDESNQCQIGDTVLAIEVRPISHSKRFKLVKVVARPAIRDTETVKAITEVPPEVKATSTEVPIGKPKKAALKVKSYSPKLAEPAK